ncbi:MAG TPA: Uma2 family endonuclease [Longimicrobium sp.]|nr:Uma2 family endonuclease [Longimicrobium sp.]
MSIQQPAARRWTYEEFARLPNDGNRYEVIGGELFVTPAPKPIHAKVATRISRVLEEFVEKHALGEVFGHAVDILFGEGDYLEPDLLFVRRERMSIVTDRGVEAAPDLVVEVLSPTTAARDRRLKRERYAMFGVPEYWLVDPVARRFEVYRRTGVGEIDAQIATDVIEWRPVSGGSVLTLNIPDLLRGMIAAEDQ